MIKDSDWSKEYCNTTHMVKDGIQYSITSYGNFAELMVYSWHSYSIVETLYFLLKNLEKIVTMKN